METKFITLQLLSESFASKLQWLVDNNNDKIAERLLQIDYHIKMYHDVSADSRGIRLQKIVLDLIKDNVTDYARQLTLKSDTFEVSFLPKGCEPVYTDSGKWAKKNRQSGKPGKIIQKVIGPGKYSNADYEKFVYSLKALWTNKGYELKLVSGEDIRNWYNCQNYYKCTSTLGNSCMSHENCSSFFDLYCEQPECQMLIALKEGKLAARALVWTIGDRTFLDRVYYIEDALLNVFINYAKERKWYLRESNGLLSDGCDQFFLSPEDDYKESKLINFELKLKRFYSEWPYVDTFRYLDANNLTMTTYNRANTHRCSFTDGNYQDSEEIFICDNCRCEWHDEEELVYSEYEGISGCTSCMMYSECMDDWISDENSVRVCVDTYYCDAACEEWLIDHPDEFVKINGVWYSIKHPNVIKDDQENYTIRSATRNTIDRSTEPTLFG